MKKFDDDLEFESLNEDSRDSRFVLPIIIVAVLLVIVIAALVLIGKMAKTKTQVPILWRQNRVGQQGKRHRTPK